MLIKAELEKPNLNKIDTWSTNIYSPFTPITLNELDKEIKNNKNVLADLDNICGKDTIDSVKSNLLDISLSTREKKVSIYQVTKKVPYVYLKSTLIRRYCSLRVFP